MKKSMNEFGFETGLTYRQKFEMLSNAGFDAIEFNLSEAMSDKTLGEVNDLSKEYGIEVAGFVANELWTHHLTSPDTSEREKAKELVRMLVRHAEAARCDSVLVVPGVVNEDVSYLSAWNNASKAIGELLPFIEEHKVNVCIENVWNKFLTSPFDMARFVDSFDSEYVASYFDAGNVLINAYPEHWIEILGKRIKRLHIKDFRRAVGNLDGFVGLMDGDMNWTSLTAALRKIGYDGFMTVEVPPYRGANEIYLKTVSAMLDLILSK